MDKWTAPDDPTDTRTRDELRADLRALGNGIHPRNSGVTEMCRRCGREAHEIDGGDS